MRPRRPTTESVSIRTADCGTEELRPRTEWGRFFDALPWYYAVTMPLPQSKYPSQSKPKTKSRGKLKAALEVEALPKAKSLPQSKLTAQGQVSVPAEVRRQLELVPGAVLEWEVKDNTAVVRRKGKYTFEDMHRILFADRPVVHHTLKELKDAIGNHLAEKHARR